MGRICIVDGSDVYIYLIGRIYKVDESGIYSFYLMAWICKVEGSEMHN